MVWFQKYCTRNFKNEDTNELFVSSQKDHSPSSCKWEDPPENGAYSVPCALGTCDGVRGSYIKQGVGRTTRCNPGHVLVQGNERDTCHDGEWSSRAHECVRKYSQQEVQSGLTPKKLVLKYLKHNLK